MEQVTLSPEYEVLIPEKIREKLGLRPGQKLEAFAYGGHVQLVPVKSASELRGFLGEIDIEIKRDPERY